MSSLDFRFVPRDATSVISYDFATLRSPDSAVD